MQASQLPPGRYVNFDKFSTLITRERCKPPREDKGECWSKGFNYCCDLLNRELLGMALTVERDVEPARPILPGDTVECLNQDMNSPPNLVAVGIRYEVHAITKDMLSFRGVSGWWPAAHFKLVGPLPNEKPELKIGIDTKKLATDITDAVKAELPRVKREAALRVIQRPLDKPAGLELGPRVQTDQRVWEVVRDIATTLLNLNDRHGLLLKVHSSTGGLFNWQSSADQPCGPSRAAQAMREAYESVFTGKRAEAPQPLPGLLQAFEQDLAKCTSGVALISAERARQITQEGWTSEHDDDHDENELARAAASYALPIDSRPHRNPNQRGRAPECWPFSQDWWKPSEHDRIKELVKAGALIAAEIDRLQRLEPARPQIEVREFATEQEARKHGRDAARVFIDLSDCLAMLRSLNAPNVPDDFKVEVASMERRELMKRVVRLSDWVTAYQKCLDGLGIEFTQPLEPRHVREIVERLDGLQVRAKHQPASAPSVFTDSAIPITDEW